jgi:hypothetical protein
MRTLPYVFALVGLVIVAQVFLTLYLRGHSLGASVALTAITVIGGLCLAVVIGYLTIRSEKS